MNQKTDDSNDSAGQGMPEDRVGEEAAIEPAEALPEPGAAPADEAFDGAVEPADADAVPPPVPARRGVSAFIAWLALLLSLAALAGSGWLLWQSRETAADSAGTEAAIAALARDLDEAVASLQAGQQSATGELNETLRESSQRIADLERELDEAVRQSESIAPRLGNLESAVSSLQGVSAGVRDTWLLAEAEYYMQIANAQLQLAGNPRIAAMALNFADERLRQMADPALGEVRRALTLELQTLEAMETVDVEGVTLALASLADRVESLPLNETVDVPANEDAPLDPELTGFSRAVASMKRAFGDIVSVRRTDQPMKPLLSPDAAYFLRANLSLTFQAARLALLRGEEGVFRQSLDDAAAWLGEYYDTDSRAVVNALATINELKDSGVSVTTPDISGSLRLLRQYRTLRDAEAPAARSGTTEPAQ